MQIYNSFFDRRSLENIRKFIQISHFVRYVTFFNFHMRISEHFTALLLLSSQFLLFDLLLLFCPGLFLYVQNLRVLKHILFFQIFYEIILSIIQRLISLGFFHFLGPSLLLVIRVFNHVSDILKSRLFCQFLLLLLGSN